MSGVILFVHKLLLLLFFCLWSAFNEHYENKKKNPFKGNEIANIDGMTIIVKKLDYTSKCCKESPVFSWEIYQWYLCIIQ